MPVRFPNTGKLQTLSDLEESDYFAHPYTNDYTPTSTSTKEDFVEANGGSIGITFSEPNMDGAVAVMQSNTFIFNGWTPPFPMAVYGYFATKGANGPLIWAHRFDESVTIWQSDQPIINSVSLRI